MELNEIVNEKYLTVLTTRNKIPGGRSTEAGSSLTRQSLFGQVRLFQDSIDIWSLFVW
jgi:hypothetical protein